MLKTYLLSAHSFYRNKWNLLDGNLYKSYLYGSVQTNFNLSCCWKTLGPATTFFLTACDPAEYECGLSYNIASVLLAKCVALSGLILNSMSNGKDSGILSLHIDTKFDQPSSQKGRFRPPNIHFYSQPSNVQMFTKQPSTRSWNNREFILIFVSLFSLLR